MSQANKISIDAKDGVRTKEMKVLVLGLGRTGTTALAAGLKQLGFTPYDYRDRFSLEGHLRHWTNAMKAKFKGMGSPWGRREFDRMTGDFDCILDVPCCFFAADLCKAYPEAKVILNTRDADEWFRSMKGTLFTVFRWPSWKLLRYTDPIHCGPWIQHNDVIWNHFCDGDYEDEEKCKQRFREHNEYVRQIVPRERLLEYDIKQGWTPITTFLGLPELTGTVNRFTTEEFIAAHGDIWRLALWNSAKSLGYAAVALCAGALISGRTRARLMKSWQRWT